MCLAQKAFLSHTHRGVLFYRPLLFHFSKWDVVLQTLFCSSSQIFTVPGGCVCFSIQIGTHICIHNLNVPSTKTIQIVFSISCPAKLNKDKLMEKVVPFMTWYLFIPWSPIEPLDDPGVSLLWRPTGLHVSSLCRSSRLILVSTSSCHQQLTSVYHLYLVHVLMTFIWILSVKIWIT